MLPAHKVCQGGRVLEQVCELLLRQQSKLQAHNFIRPLPYSAPLPPSLVSPIRPVTGVLRTLGTCTRGSRGAKNNEGTCGVEAFKRHAHSAGGHVAGMQARAATPPPCPDSNRAATRHAPGTPCSAWKEGRRSGEVEGWLGFTCTSTATGV